MPRAALAVVVALPPGSGAAVEPTIGDRTITAVASAVADSHADETELVHPDSAGDWWQALLGVALDEERALADADVVVVHDARRALAGDDLWHRVLVAATEGADVSVPSLPVTDTVRDHDGTLVDRSILVECQTPRAYRVATLRALASVDASDDLDALVAAGMAAVLVEGSGSAAAIRTPEELAVVQARTTP